MQTSFIIVALVASCTAKSLSPTVPNIVQLAQSVPELSTLVQAVVAAGLADTLSGPGPFTVFAPTNEAFAALPAGLLAHLLTPEGKPTLVSILTYHVASGSVQSKQLFNGERITMVEGENVSVTIAGGSVLIRDATGSLSSVISADNQASNGVVHIVSRVLIPAHPAPPAPPAPPSPPAPPAGKNIVQLAESVPDLSTLVKAVVAAGLADTLSGPGPFTVFAPTNEAFALLPPDVLQKLLEPANKDELVKILTYHVVSGEVHARDLKDNELVKTVEGQDVLVHINGFSVYLQDRRAENPRDFAKVITADVQATNGVVHLINRVIIPQ